MQLKPQDIVVLLKLVGSDGHWTYRSLSEELFMSTGEIHNALNRCEFAQLYDSSSRSPFSRALEEFIVHGVKYAFPAKRGAITRGIPTAHAAAPLNKMITTAVGEQPPVWPDPEGSVRGYSLEPLYPSVTKASKQDGFLYELLALVDAIRVGRAREKNIAIEQLHQRLRTGNAKA